MTFPEVHYLRWAKALPPAAANLARSGLDPCPAALLGLRATDLVTSLPVRDGYRPLVEAIATRYRVTPSRVFTVPGGTSLANFMACAAVLNDAPRGSEVIVEHPAYEPLVRGPGAPGRGPPPGSPPPPPPPHPRLAAAGGGRGGGGASVVCSHAV